MAKRIAFVNHKGGVGKTTCCVSIAHGLARAGKRVLLVDVDPQGNSSQSFGVKHDKTLYHLLTDQAQLHECIAHARENLDIITGGKAVAVAEQNIFGEMARERYLSEYTSRNGINDEYNYIFFDCAPSWRLLNQNAMVASELVIVPVNMEYFALGAVKEILIDIKKINELLNHNLSIGLVVPTFYDVRNRKSSRILEQLIEFFGKDKVADPIRTSVRISEATYFGKTIFEYALHSRGADDFEFLTRRVLKL